VVVVVRMEVPECGVPECGVRWRETSLVIDVD